MGGRLNTFRRASARRTAALLGARQRTSTQRPNFPRFTAHRIAAHRNAGFRTAPQRPTLMSQDKAIPELSNDVRVLVTKLIEIQPGATISYAELTKLIARDVQSAARHLLVSARRVVQRRHGLVFEAVMNIGLKRLDTAGLAAAAPSYVARTHRMARRGTAKLLCAKPDELPEADRSRLYAHTAALGVIADITKPKKLALLEGRAAQSAVPLALQETLAVFKS